jgi:hypothetical protein
MSRICKCSQSPAIPPSSLHFTTLTLRSQKGIEAAGEASKANAQKAAFAAETEAYNDSHSLVSPYLFYLYMSMALRGVTCYYISCIPPSISRRLKLSNYVSASPRLELSLPSSCWKAFFSDGEGNRREGKRRRALYDSIFRRLSTIGVLAQRSAPDSSSLFSDPVSMTGCVWCGSTGDHRFKSDALMFLHLLHIYDAYPSIFFQTAPSRAKI